MAKVPLTLEKWERNVLKGLPLPEGDSSISSGKWKDLEFNFNTEVDDTFLMSAYHVYLSLSLSSSREEDKDPTLLVLVASKLLGFFVQLNSTGPSAGMMISEATLCAYQGDSTTIPIESLRVDGLEVSDHVKIPQLLVIVEELLKVSSSRVDMWVGRLHGWWGIRMWFLHQKILDGRSPTLAGKIGSAAAAIGEQMDSGCGDEDLKALWWCEMSDIHLHYYDVVNAKGCLEKGEEAAGVKFYMTGLLGKRTKYQEKDLAQLVVKAEVNQTERVEETEENLTFYEEFKGCTSLVNVPLEDDTRLEKVKLKDDNGHVSGSSGSLTVVQQIVLLAGLNYMKKSTPKDDLQKEEVLAYVGKLLEDPKLWSVFVVSLLLRSSVETNHRRTVERSMLQFENLQKSIIQDTSPKFPARYQFYFASSMPYIWEIDMALADVLVSLGHFKSALDIYLKLNMWEEVIACYSLLELKHKAEEVIRQRISRDGETPKLLVYLGDATDDIDLYERAWDLSQGKNFLSRQRLGQYWFKKGEYAKAIPYLRKAVELNPLEYPVWIRLGYAALEAEDWELAVKAYSHANTLDDESFENWNNLAKAALNLGNKGQALRALKQATKCDYEQWKVWENLMVAALQCQDLEWTILAFNRLIDLKGSFVDETVLRILVDLVTDEGWDKQGQVSSKTRDGLQTLLGRITSKINTNPDVWYCYSTFLYRTMSNNKATEVEQTWYNVLQYQQKAVRCRIQNKHWDLTPESARPVVSDVYTLCERTSKLMTEFPEHPSAKDFKIQSQFLHKQVLSVIHKRLKDVADPSSSLYSEYAMKLDKRFLD